MSRELPKGFTAQLSPETGLTTYVNPEWTDIQLTQDYTVTFHRVESHILSSYPRGRVTQEGTRALFDAYTRFLKASGLINGPFVEISDYSGLTNMPSKRARVEVGLQLVDQAVQNRLIGHFVYNVPRYIKWLYNIGTRLKAPGIPMLALESYGDAIFHAMALKPGTSGTGNWLGKIREKLQGKRKLARGAEGLLDYIGRINWDEEGVLEHPVPDTHPLKLVYNAIAVLKADYDRALREREKIQRKYKDLFNHIADPILVFEQGSNMIVDCNNAFLDVYGYSREELARMTPEDLHPEQEKGEVELNIDDGRRRETHRHTHVTREGRVIDVEIRTDETDYQGRPAWISNIRDITDQKRLETELRQHRDILETMVRKRTRALEDEIAERNLTETKFKTLFDANADAVMLLDKKGFIDCNQAALDLFGLESKSAFSEIEPADVSPLYQEDGRASRELVREKLSQAFKKGSSHFEWTHRNLKTGQVFPADVLLTRMVLDGKDVLQAVVRDITQRRASEEALRQSEAKYRGIIQNMQDVFYRTDMDQNLTMISPSGLRLLGYDHETEVLGRHMGTLFFENSSEWQRFMEVMSTEEKVSNFELWIHTRKGLLIPVITSSNYFQDPRGRPMGIEGTITSIRELKEAEEALRLAKIQAESAARVKSEFLANMSHEIRTPMNAILGMGELFAETAMDDYQKSLITTINTEADSLLDIINSILDLSKVEAGRLELEETPFNLRGLFEDMAAGFSVAAHQKHLEFISFLPPGTPEALVGDPGRLRQILVNLIGNAIKFTAEGEVFVSADPLEVDDKTVTIKFIVQDTGIGIPKEKQEFIFESFAQADGSFTRRYGGTGLGTTISRQLVKIMGGSIGLESVEGHGATFWFTITLHRDPAVRLPLPEPGDSPLLGKQVAVAVGNPRSRQVLSAYLNAWGCRPLETDSAQAMTSLVLDRQPDLILLDQQLPDTDGFQAVTALRREESGRATPVILLTSMSNPGGDQRCRNLDIRGYLMKPVKQNDLKSALEVAISPLGHTKTPSLPPGHTIADTRIQNAQILLVEDYPANQQVAVRHLLSQGYRVNLAKDGQQAVDMFKAKTYDLVLMDVQMPVMDGYEATRQIREWEEKTRADWEGVGPDKRGLFQRTPIIAMTAHAIKGFKEKCLAKGMDDFLSKPLRKKTFLGMVAAHLPPEEDQSPQAQAPGSDPGRKPDTHEKAGSPPGPSGGPPMDLDTALEEFDGDRDFLCEVLEEFLTTLARQLPVMDRAAGQKEFQVLAREAHAIKGGAANLTASSLSRAAAAIEALSKSQDQGSLAEALDRLLFEFARLKEFSQGL